MNQITINNRDVSVVEYNGQRVVTLAMIDEVHQRPEGTARKRFNDNKARFVEGEDFLKISASEFRTRNLAAISAKATEDITLLTESGYLMLVKSFTDDLAWQVQRQLVRSYFRQEAPAKVPAPRKSISGFSRTFEALHKIAVRHLGLDEAQATIHASHGTDYLHGFNPLEAMRVSRIESPVEKSFFVVTDIAKREGFQSAQWLNKAFEALGLQTDTGNEDCRWKPTDLGRPYCRIVDNPIKGRRSRQSLMWSLDVVPLVRAHLGTSATPYGSVSATPDEDLLGGIK